MVTLFKYIHKYIYVFYYLLGLLDWYLNNIYKLDKYCIE